MRRVRQATHVIALQLVVVGREPVDRSAQEGNASTCVSVREGVFVCAEGRGGKDDGRGGKDDGRGGKDDGRGGKDDERGGKDDERGGKDDGRGGKDEGRGGGKDDALRRIACARIA